MALETVGNVKHAPLTNFNEINSSDDDHMAIDEDLEDGEILDEESTVTKCPLNQTTEPLSATLHAKIKTELQRDVGFQIDNSNQWREDKVEKQFRKRVRPKHHNRKSHRDGDQGPHNSKITKHGVPQQMQYGQNSGVSNNRKRQHAGGPENSKKNKRKRNNKGKAQKQQQVVKKKDCMFWAQGRCNKGDDCPFSHAACPERKMELCKFYLMDSCSKNEKCLFMHSDFPCKFYHTGMKCFSREQCKFSHEPLTDITRAILIKFIDAESEDTDTFGDCPNPFRDTSKGQIILSKPKLHTTQTRPMSIPSSKKIPSLFDIKINPPPELLNTLQSLNENSNVKVKPATKVKDEIIEPPSEPVIQNFVKPQGFYHDLSQSSKSEVKKEKVVNYEDFKIGVRELEDSEIIDFLSEEEPETEFEKNCKQFVKMITECKNENLYSEIDIKVEQVDTPEMRIEVRDESPSPPPPEYDDDMYAPRQPRRWQLEDYVADNYPSESSDDDDNVLVMASSDTDDDDDDADDIENYEIRPPKAKEPLVQVAEADSSGIEDTDIPISVAQDDDATSSDDDNIHTASNDAFLQRLPKNQRALFLRIKQQQQQEAAQNQASASTKPSQVSKKQEEKHITKEDWYSSDDDGEESLMNSVLHNLSNQSSNHDGLAPNVKETSGSSVKQSTSREASLLHTSGPASLSQSKTTTRDPRLVCELQSQVPIPNRDPRTSKIKIEDVDSRVFPTTPPKNHDLDMRISNIKSNSNVTLAQSSKDTDLRHLSDTDLRIAATTFQLPLNTEINASLTSHPPIQYTPIPFKINGPDYSKLNLDFNNLSVRNDPRLKKFVIEFDEKNASHSSPVKLDM